MRTKIKTAKKNAGISGLPKVFSKTRNGARTRTVNSKKHRAINSHFPVLCILVSFFSSVFFIFPSSHGRCRAGDSAEHSDMIIIHPLDKKAPFAVEFANSLFREVDVKIILRVFSGKGPSLKFVLKIVMKKL